MIDVESPEGLMVWLMNFMADRFGGNAILKGGMELRLLDCPRYTNDIDYVFVPFSSKREVRERVVEAFSKVEGLQVEYSLNSKCLRCYCEYNGHRAQIEIQVAETCETRELTTAGLARQHNLQGRILRGMRFDCALAHKIAAWNEWRLIRDLYDCYFLAHVLAVRPHIPTLEQRLTKVEIRTGRKSRKTSMTPEKLLDNFENAIRSLSQKDIEEQMRDFFSPEQFPGLEEKMRSGLMNLLETMRSEFRV